MTRATRALLVLCLDKPGHKIVLTFEDSMGNMGVSNPFRVRPK